MPDGWEIDIVKQTASDISENTRLSKKQATALLMREVLDASNQDIAEVLQVGSPASASSYVTRCRSKFRSVDEKIAELEKEIEQWERTEQLEHILDQFDTERTDTDTGIEELSDLIQRELVEEEDVMYLIAHIGNQGRERIITTDTHPRNIEHTEVLQYKRITSVDEVFE